MSGITQLASGKWQVQLKTGGVYKYIGVADDQAGAEKPGQAGGRPPDGAPTVSPWCITIGRTIGAGREGAVRPGHRRPDAAGVL